MKIVWVAFRGHYSDSPRALYEAVVARGSDAEHLWLTSSRTEHTFPKGVATARFGSPESIAALEAADLVVSNDHVPLDWEKKAGATYLQTWHGTPLKRIHNDVLWAPEGRLAYLDQDIARWDLMLSPNSTSTALFRQAFGYRGPLHETGYPRNDVLSGDRAAEVRAAVRAQLGLDEGTTAVLYTPTWRDDLVFEGTGERDFEFPIDIERFAERFGADHVLLLRLHSMVSDRLEVPAGAPVRDVSGFPDVSDLYLAADLMVTDYSSTMFDFGVTGKPMLFYAYDLDDYRDRLRGFYLDYEETVPGPILRTGEELFDAIADVEAVTAANAERYAGFRDRFCSLEDGRATDRVLELLAPTGLVPTTVPTTSEESARVRS